MAWWRRCEGEVLRRAAGRHAERHRKRKLKTYQTSLGFYDQAIAAPSMKAALEAWGASSNLFHQGAAKETDDPDIVAATMASRAWCSGVRSDPAARSPRTPRCRPISLTMRPSENPNPKSKPESKSKSKQRPAEGVTKQSRKIDDQDARKAAAAFEKEERRREAERRKEEVALAKERARARDKAVARRRRRWTRRGGSTTRRRRRSKPSGLCSTNAPRPSRAGGTSRG